MAANENEKTVAGATDPIAAAAEFEQELQATPTNTQDYVDPVAALGAKIGITDPDALRLIISAATAELTATHKAEIGALRQEIETVRQTAQQGEMRGGLKDNNESMGGFPWMYYRLPQTWPDKTRAGWITIGPGGASPRSGKRDTGSFARYLQKGMVPITKYGLCPVPTSVNASDTFLMFVQNGGAVEFPASQIVAYQWHKKNPFAKIGIRFRQVEAIIDKLQSFTCEYCGYSLDFMPDDKMAGTAYRQHLTNADKIPFKEAIEAVKASGLSTTPFRARTVDEMMAMSAPE